MCLLCLKWVISIIFIYNWWNSNITSCARATRTIMCRNALDWTCWYIVVHAYASTYVTWGFYTHQSSFKVHLKYLWSPRYYQVLLKVQILENYLTNICSCIMLICVSILSCNIKCFLVFICEMLPYLYTLNTYHTNIFRSFFRV